MQRAPVTRVSCIALGLPRTTLTRVALVVVVILVVTLQMHYKHTHTQTERGRACGGNGGTLTHTATRIGNICEFSLRGQSRHVGGECWECKEREATEWSGVRGLAVNLPLLLFLKRFSISSFSSSVNLPSPRSHSPSPTQSLSLSRSSGVAVVVIAAIEVLFYAQFVCCGT